MDKGTNKKIIVKLLCVILSFALWFYITNVENPNRTSDITSVPVEIENANVLAESNLVIAPDQNFTVDLRLEGPANEIYRVSKDDFKIKLDLGAYALKIGENTIPVQLVNYPQGINIKNTGSLTVKIKIEELVHKDVNVVSKVNTSFDKGFSQSSISVNPSKVEVSGPSSVIDKVDSVALIGKADKISENFDETFELKPIDKEGTEITGAEISQKEGTLSMKVAKQKDVSINLKYSGSLKSGLSIESSELSRKTVSIIGEVGTIDKIESLDTEPVNLDNINDTSSLDVKIKLPDGIKISDDNEYTSVKINIKNTQIITKTIDGVTVDYLDKDNKFKYNAPSLISVTVSGTAEDLANITASNIKASASLKDIVAVGDYNITWNAELVNTAANVTLSTKSGIVIVKVQAP